jgi:hypothetical protein
MDSFIIQPTEDSPSVNFDTTTNYFVISGTSRPENSRTFYTPIINWIASYEEILAERKQQGNQTPLVFEYRFDYFNSSSAKFILDILLILKRFSENGYPLEVIWKCDARDEDMLDMGREFSDMADLQFEYIQY